MLPRDKHIRRRPAELATRFYDKIRRLAAQAKPPVMVSVTRSGISKPIKFK